MDGRVHSVLNGLNMNYFSYRMQRKKTATNLTMYLKIHILTPLSTQMVPTMSVYLNLPQAQQGKGVNSYANNLTKVAKSFFNPFIPNIKTTLVGSKPLNRRVHLNNSVLKGLIKPMTF